MTTPTPAQRRESKAKQRRLQKEREPLQRALRHVQALEQALADWGLPETLAVEVEWQRRSLGKLLGKIFGVLFPAVGGCRTPDELTRVRAWDKNLPTTLLGALPQQKWGRPLPHRGHDRWTRRWRQVQDNSPATRRRWPWTWAGDDSVLTKYGQQLGRVGTW